MSRYQKQPSFETRIITGVGKILWALVSLSFRKKKSGDVVERWREVQDLMEKSDAHAFAMAVVKADSILDSMLKARLKEQRQVSRDKTMGEQLKAMEGKLDRDTLQSAWDAHKIRNLIVHGDRDITHTQAQEAVGKFRSVLNKLNGI